MHDLIVDTEMVHTNDGPPQPRSSNFVECLDLNCEWCHGNLILHDNEIAEYINKLEKENRDYLWCIKYLNEWGVSKDQKLSHIIRSAQQSVHPTASGAGGRRFLANLLVSLGKYLVKIGGG